MEEGAAGVALVLRLEPQPELKLGLPLGELPFVGVLVDELPQPASKTNARAAPRIKK